MRALVLEDVGRPPRLGSFADPEAGPSTEVIAVTAAGLNPFDAVYSAGRHPIGAPPLPSVVGREGVGRTAADRRIYFESAQAPYGSVAEQTLVESEAIFDVPAEVDDATAIALGAAGISAWLPLVERARLRAGEGVLVLGATGAVGSIAVQLAKLLGAGRVVAAGRRKAALQRCVERGADATVDLAREDLASAMSKAADGPIDVVIDLLWGMPARAALEVCAHGARLVQIGNSAATEVPLAAHSWRTRWVSILGYSGLAVPAALKRDAYAALMQHAAAGRLAVDVEAIPFEDAGDAWRRLVAGPDRKLILTMTNVAQQPGRRSGILETSTRAVASPPRPARGLHVFPSAEREQLSIGASTGIAGPQASLRGAYCVLDQIVPPRFLAPVHAHEREDQAFWILSGSLVVWVDGDRADIGAGDFVVRPAGRPHALWNPHDVPAHVLEITSPGDRFEAYMRELSTSLDLGQATPESVAELAAGYGIDFLPEITERLVAETGLSTSGGFWRR